MNTNYPPKNSYDNRLTTQGGRFILHVHTYSQLLASAIGPLFGVFFIYITANLSQNQFIQFLVSMASAIVLVNILHAIYARIITKHARLYLDHIFRNLSLPESSNELIAWDEIIALPRRSSIAQVVMVYILIITPVILYMRWSAGVNPTQIISIVIGGSLSAMAALVQGFLFLDIQLNPARQALLPVDPTQQDVRISVGQRTRQYFVTSILLLMAILTIGGIGYQKLLAVTAPGANPDAILFQYQTQLIVMGIAIFIVGTFLASRLAQAVSLPTKELIRVMEVVKKGDYTERAHIMTSDDMAQLTIRLNQMLDQLQTTESSMENLVQERTASLEHRGKQLQAAAQVAREAASLQDLNLLLSRTVKLISEQFGYYHAGIFLIDDSGEYVELQAASSEGGRRMLARGHRLAVGQQGIVGAAAYQNRPRIAKDVSADRTYTNNPDLPLTRSEAAIPLITHGKVIGVLDIQSTEKSEFEASDVGILQILADQISLAIQNARLITESKDAIQRLQSTTAENLRRVWRERVRGVKNAYRFTSAGLSSGLQQEAQRPTNVSESNYLNLPITLRGQKIGTITLHRRGDSKWSESDRSLAIEVSDQVGLALENARLLEEAQQHAAQEQSLSELSARLSRSLDPDTLLQTTIRELHQLPNVSEISTSLIPPGKLPSGEAN